MPETLSRRTIDFAKFYSALETVNLMDCQGYVVRVTGSTVESAGPVLGLGSLCGIHTRDGRRILAQVVGFRQDHLILLPLEHIEGVSPGDAVTARTTPRHILLSEKVLGRVLNGLGEPIDGKGPLPEGDKCPLDVESPPPLSREKITQPLALGIRSIDGVITTARGQRIGIFAGSGVGKSVLLGDIAVSSDAAVNVVALIGERGREVREFLEENLGPEGLARSVVVVATSDTPPIQ
ncbi:MAG TPA: EscN/YscN/HrcN family type III secretion system ATPase, partial [Sedimentisphaerales bacterium]|nr:EscN/YscN/HrcN family type III secretion system ATPase [Sedimentisphaerales bacterium]